MNVIEKELIFKVKPNYQTFLSNNWGHCTPYISSFILYIL